MFDLIKKDTTKAQKKMNGKLQAKYEIKLGIPDLNPSLGINEDKEVFVHVSDNLFNDEPVDIRTKLLAAKRLVDLALEDFE